MTLGSLSSLGTRPRPPPWLMGTIRSLLLHLPDLKLSEAEAAYSYLEGQLTCSWAALMLLAQAQEKWFNNTWRRGKCRVGILKLRKILILPGVEAEEEPCSSSPWSETIFQLQETEGYTTVMWITLLKAPSKISMRTTKTMPKTSSHCQNQCIYP